VSVSYSVLIELVYIALISM